MVVGVLPYTKECNAIIHKGTSFVQCISVHINVAPIKGTFCHPGST